MHGCWDGPIDSIDRYRVGSSLNVPIRPPTYTGVDRIVTRPTRSDRWLRNQPVTHVIALTLAFEPRIRIVVESGACGGSRDFALF
jgi:hypothetical protein